MARKTSATSFIALIRGVNVGGKMLSMERLREALGESGFANVRTYIQSGNVVFNVSRGSSEQLAKKIEALILTDFALSVSVVVRTAGEMRCIVDGNPFLAESGIDEARLHVTFLATAPTRAGIEALAALPAGVDRFQHSAKELYLYCPNGYGKTKLSNNVLEKVLATRATTRNWNSVRKLEGMAREREGRG